MLTVSKPPITVFINVINMLFFVKTEQSIIQTTLTSDTNDPCNKHLYGKIKSQKTSAEVIDVYSKTKQVHYIVQETIN